MSSFCIFQEFISLVFEKLPQLRYAMNSFSLLYQIVGHPAIEYYGVKKYLQDRSAL